MIWVWIKQINKTIVAIVLFADAFLYLSFVISESVVVFVAMLYRFTTSESTDFNVTQYKKIVNNMLWINVLFIFYYLPHLPLLIATLYTLYFQSC